MRRTLSFMYVTLSSCSCVSDEHFRAHKASRSSIPSAVGAGAAGCTGAGAGTARIGIGAGAGACMGMGTGAGAGTDACMGTNTGGGATGASSSSSTNASKLPISCGGPRDAECGPPEIRARLISAVAFVSDRKTLQERRFPVLRALARAPRRVTEHQRGERPGWRCVYR